MPASTPILIQADECRRTAWRNGGGLTRELLPVLRRASDWSADQPRGCRGTDRSRYFPATSAGFRSLTAPAYGCRWTEPITCCSQDTSRCASVVSCRRTAHSWMARPPILISCTPAAVPHGASAVGNCLARVVADVAAVHARRGTSGSGRIRRGRIALPAHCLLWLDDSPTPLDFHCGEPSAWHPGLGWIRALSRRFVGLDRLCRHTPRRRRDSQPRPSRVRPAGRCARAPCRRACRPRACRRPRARPAPARPRA